MKDPHVAGGVNQVVMGADIDRSQLLPEEIAYIGEHALNKPLHVTHVWALSVGVVITGEYFGWNFGLPIGGPVGVLVASLIVCVLYLAWVLALSELQWPCRSRADHWPSDGELPGSGSAL
jgi:amino acid permease